MYGMHWICRHVNAESWTVDFFKIIYDKNVSYIKCFTVCVFMSYHTTVQEHQYNNTLLLWCYPHPSSRIVNWRDVALNYGIWRNSQHGYYELLVKHGKYSHMAKATRNPQTYDGLTYGHVCATYLRWPILFAGSKIHALYNIHSYKLIGHLR